MTGFLIAAAVLIAAGLASLLWPLLRGARAGDERQTGAVVAQFREKLKELEAERAAGTIDQPQYEQNRREIERQLLEAVAAPVQAPSGPPRARWSAALIGIFLVVAPVVLYATLGTPDALVPGVADAPADAGGAHAQARAGAKPLTNTQVQKMVDGLNEALKKNPSDAQGWSMLARAYAYLHQYPDAVRAFTKAVALTPKDARLLADLADAMAMTNNQRLDGEPMRLIERALQIDPKDVKALALAGTGEFDHQHYAKAAEYWQRAIDAAPNLSLIHI